ncbi:uncharacterized protein HKW66_Vig0252990 [Vigna angularis]|uniref:Uncharacterized protein n=1 Tax=Phaseolus angularis TaxID=3914 RepID=A0A8T0K3U4_PHAAN|nr:uncharacterized protein LOC128193370 [Vigna angularis]XP_052736351.1 uncharacterized protein LOC128193370 [Vigna angularis]XP_052736352.1 uncharacterized protein LOC128193370 [Vigna angularis]KAG2390763.1 uncharacterized protein HKW66_Vig0252990 [Vigna angularis]
MPLMSEDPSNCGNTEVEPNLGVSFAVKDEKDVSDHELENDTWEPVSLQRDEDTHYSVDTGTCQSPKKGNKEDAVGALGVKFKLEKKIVDLSDDEDKYTSHGLHGEKAISQIIEENEYPQLVEIIKRKRASDIEASTSTSTSSTDLFEKENLPVKKTPLATPTPVTPLVSSPSLSLSWQSRYLTSPPSPPSCHVKWKRARMTSSGQFSSESALQIAKRIDSLEMQSKQGMFHSDADFDGPSGRKKGPGETSQGDPTIDLSIVVSGRSDQPPRQEPTAHELVPILTKRLVLDGNPTYLRKLVDRGEIGYRRVGAGKALTARSFNVNVRYFRDSIKDVMTKVLTVRYENLGDMRPTDITAEITTYVPHIADICMTALYAKLRSINLAYGQHATRYTTAPSYTKDIELPLPLALAIQEFGSFQSHSLESNLIMIPTYPEGTQHEGRSAAAYPFAEYLTYVPTLARLGIPLKSVDAGVKTGSAWWTFKLEVIFGSADLICTLPRSHYSDMSAQLRMLFIAGDETHPPEDIVSLPATYNNFGTLASLITKQYNSRTFLAIIHGPKEEWDYGTV